MNTLSFKTHFARPDEADKKWVVVDATDQIVGRMSSKVAKILRGKYKPCFTPNQDCGDNVIIINADKIQFTGAKWTDKEYITFSGYPGGQHRISPMELAKRPRGYERMVTHAVKGMLPKGRLGSKILKNLHFFNAADYKEGEELTLQVRDENGRRKSLHVTPEKIDINLLK